jgi:fumarate hydratase class II
MTTFNTYCASGIIPNLAVIDKNLNNSLMLVTALNPHIGYDKSARIAKYAYENDLTLKEAAISLNIIDEETFDKLVDPKRMV